VNVGIHIFSQIDKFCPKTKADFHRSWHLLNDFWRYVSNKTQTQTKMERKMIFVKDWSTLLQGLTTMVRRFEKPFYEPCFEALIRYESLPLRILSRKSSFLQNCVYSKKAVILSVFLTERKHFPKFSNFVNWLLLSLTNTNLPMLFTIRQQFSWQLRWMQLTFNPLSRDTRLFTQGHTCVNRMQGHTCVNRKSDSNSKR
jgi:hypothetical protein